MLRYQQRAAPPPGDDPLEFVLSDDTVDRMGDVIEQTGWLLSHFRKNPIALFNHDPNQVIGRWRDVAVRSGRLTGFLELAEAGTSAIVDAVRALVRQKILRAVSVGFRSLKKEKLTPEASDWGGPFRFLKTDLLECSLVSVPANPNAVALTKGLPRDVLDTIFSKPANEIRVPAVALTGKHAERYPVLKVQTMTLSQKIQAAQKRLNDMRDRLAALVKNDDLGDDETHERDELPDLIDAEASELARLERFEKTLAPRPGTETPTPTDPGPGRELVPAGDPRAIVLPARKKIEPVDYGFRAVAIMARSFSQQITLDEAMRTMYGADEATGIILRAAVNPAMTTVAGWAAELVQTANAAILDRLVAESIYGPLAGMGARYDLGRNGSIKIPVRAATPRASGNWVGEGAPKPVKRIGLSSITLTPHKLAVISTFTEEMGLYSVPAIEGLLRTSLQDDTSEALDGYLIDNVAASASRPAGLLNGVTPIAAAATGTATEKMIADLKAIVAAIVAAGGGRAMAILINPAQAMALGFGQTTTGDFLFATIDEAGRKFNVRFISSRTVPAGTVIGVDAADFATVTGDAPRFAVSNEATLHEEDTSPLPISATGTPNTVAAPIRSLFQTDSIAIRLSLYVTWAMRRAGMVQTIAGVGW